jgi:hypothetical protein
VVLLQSLIAVIRTRSPSIRYPDFTGSPEADGIEAAAALRPHECVSILKVMVGGGMEGAAVRGMSKVLDSRLCNESGMMFEFDTNEMGRSVTRPPRTRPRTPRALIPQISATASIRARGCSVPLALGRGDASRGGDALLRRARSVPLPPAGGRTSCVVRRARGRCGVPGRRSRPWTSFIGCTTSGTT